MGGRSTRASFREQQVVDDALLAYVEWREECERLAVVRPLWKWMFGRCGARARGLSGALDREEAAAWVYARIIEGLVHLLEAGSDHPLVPRSCGRA
jgi:hypothetical protein